MLQVCTQKIAFISFFIKVLDILMLPDCDTDWAENPATEDEMKQKRKRCLKKTMMFSILQSFYNLVLLTPFWFTGRQQSVLKIGLIDL